MLPAPLSSLNVDLAVVEPETRIQRVPFLQALHRRSAEDIRLNGDRPLCDRALRAGWCLFPGPGPRRELGIIPAGGGIAPALRSGDTMAVLPGSPIPDGCAVVDAPDQGADAVVGAGIERRAARGHDQDLVVKAGDHLDPARLGRAAAAGLDEIAVIAPARTAILSLAPAEGGDGLGALLLGWCQGWHLPASRHRLPSDPPNRLEVLGNACDRAKVVITASGGAALAEAARTLGFSPLTALAGLPGCGIAQRHTGTLLVDLPADVDGALLGIHLLAWPLLARLGSLPEPDWRPVAIPVPGLRPLLHTASGMTAADAWSAGDGIAWDAHWLPWCHSYPRW